MIYLEKYGIDISVGDFVIYFNHVYKIADKKDRGHNVVLTVHPLTKTNRISKKTHIIFFRNYEAFNATDTVQEALELLAELNKPDENLPFFVYGTLRKGMGNYEGYLAGMTENEKPATVVGRLYHGGSLIPFMTQEKGVVHGELMYVNDSEFVDVLEGLDSLEGYNKRSEYNFYNRVRTMTTLKDGSQVEAYAYVIDEADGLERIQHGDYSRWRYETISQR